MTKNIYTDGSGPHGNGIGSASFVITSDVGGVETVIHGDAKPLCSEVAKALHVDKITNNIAEYMAVILALEHVLEITPPGTDFVVYSDSQLMINQITGVYDVKAEHLKYFYTKTLHLQKHLEWRKINITFQWISRDNRFIKEADRLGRLAIKSHK